jgi:hypothetical protein
VKKKIAKSADEWKLRRLLLELSVVDESPQLGLFDEIELLLLDEWFSVNSW